MSAEQPSSMALVRRNYGRAADPIEIIDDTDDDAIETIDITDDDDVDKEAMSDMDSLPSDIEDDMHNENQGTDSLFYAYDVEKELDQFVVTPDIGRVIESIGTCRDIAKKLSSVAREIEIDHAGQIEPLLQAQTYMSPRTFIAFLGEIGVGKSKTVDSLLNCPDAAPTVGENKPLCDTNPFLTLDRAIREKQRPRNQLNTSKRKTDTAELSLEKSFSIAFRRRFKSSRSRYMSSGCLYTWKMKQRSMISKRLHRPL